MENNWTNWRAIPSPENFLNLNVKSVPGVFQVRNKLTNEFLLVGDTVNLLKRMKMLMPPPYGTTKSYPSYYRNYICDNWKDIEYRIHETVDKKEAVKVCRETRNSLQHKFTLRGK